MSQAVSSIQYEIRHMRLAVQEMQYEKGSMKHVV